MKAAVVVGAQWGDEGKAKVIDFLTEHADIVVRYQGGANAGHTVVTDGQKHVFHLVPSGVLYADKICVIGNGVVLDPTAFLAEVRELAQRGVDAAGRVFVSSRAHLILPVHAALDRAAEVSMGGRAIGTTGRGIGPAYVDKAGRLGVQVADLLDRERFRRRVGRIVERANALLVNLYGAEPVAAEEVVAAGLATADELRPMVRDVALLLDREMRAGKRVLLEGAQGTMLDLDHGTYPFVTSSNSTAGGACAGAGVGPTRIGRVIGIAKAYATRVGNGPFPTQIDGPLAEKVRTWGGEFGATTGRPRRCGWFDVLAARHAVRVNGLDELAVTKLDVLDELDEIPVCTGYRLNGELLTETPLRGRDLEAVEPIYEHLPGWRSRTTGARSLHDLPAAAREYLDRLAEWAGVPVGIVSVGPDRQQTLTTSNHRAFVTD